MVLVKDFQSRNQTVARARIGSRARAKAKHVQQEPVPGASEGEKRILLSALAM
jgi:hypothetical protein